jgi:flavin reductase (DIM6/NTAB) family NADH-FMN oxidoreductase RutF
MGGPITEISAKVRQEMRRLPHSVVVITTAKHKGEDEQHPSHRGMTVSSFTTVTLSPNPVISFNIKRPSRTYEAILESKYFHIHLLTATTNGAALANHFVKPIKSNRSKFHLEDLEAIDIYVEDTNLGHPNQPGGPELPKLPMLVGPGVMTVLFCKLRANNFDNSVEGKGVVHVGDHTIVVAEVLRVEEFAEGRDKLRKGLYYSHGAYLDRRGNPIFVYDHTSDSRVSKAKEKEAKNAEEGGLVPLTRKARELGQERRDMLYTGIKRVTLERPEGQTTGGGTLGLEQGTSEDESSSLPWYVPQSAYTESSYTGETATSEAGPVPRSVRAGETEVKKLQEVELAPLTWKEWKLVLKRRGVMRTKEERQAVVRRVLERPNGEIYGEESRGLEQGTSGDESSSLPWYVPQSAYDETSYVGETATSDARPLCSNFEQKSVSNGLEAEAPRPEEAAPSKKPLASISSEKAAQESRDEAISLEASRHAREKREAAALEWW